jgi:hypothetical protein
MGGPGRAEGILSVRYCRFSTRNLPLLYSLAGATMSRLVTNDSSSDKKEFIS